VFVTPQFLHASAANTAAPATSFSGGFCDLVAFPNKPSMAHSSVSLSKTRPPPLSGWRASAANFRRFAVRNQAALALAFVLCGTAACLLIVESEEPYTDPVTLVTRSRHKNTSFVSQIRESLFGFILGIVFILVAIPIIVSTEFRAVRNWKILVEVEHKCRKISPDEIQSALDGKLIHFNGPLATKPDDSSKNVCRDTQLNVSFPNALHVYRKVEMMQWKRTILSKTSTNEECVYTREWSDSFDDNSEYNANCTNPQMRVTSTTVEVPVRLGAFTICPEHLTRLTHKPNPLSSLDRAAVVAAFQAIVPNVSPMGEIGDGDLILAQHPESSEREIGDYRITYFSVDQGHEMSIVGMQNMKTVSKFIPVYNSEGGGVMLIKVIIFFQLCRSAV
jgi:hypothetical protein